MSTGDRVRNAVSTGRSEMRRREEEIWAELAARGVGSDGAPSLEPPVAEPESEPQSEVEAKAEPEPRRRGGRRNGSGRHAGGRQTRATRGSTSHTAT